MRVDGDYVNLVKSCSILELEFLSIVTSLGIDFFGLLVEILIPEFHVNLQHGIRLSEILAISHFKIMITLKRIDLVTRKVSGHEVS